MAYYISGHSRDILEMTKRSLSPSESFAQSWHLVEESSLRTEPSSGEGGGGEGDPIVPQGRPGMKQ